MTRPETLTKKQKEIIDQNIGLFPAQIKALPGFEDKKITRDVIRAYQNKVKKSVEPDIKEALARDLQRYIDLNGLPSRFHGKNNVTGFLQFLKQQ